MTNRARAVMIQGDREVFCEDINHICTILERFPRLSRTEVVHTLCETLNWLTPAGHPKLNACRKLLYRLEQQGIIRLPSIRQEKSHPGAYRTRHPSAECPDRCAATPGNVFGGAWRRAAEPAYGQGG